MADAGLPIDGASDHGVSEAIYLRDPDSNGVELYRDRGEADWPRTPEIGLGIDFLLRPQFEEKVLEHKEGHYVVQE